MPKQINTSPVAESNRDAFSPGSGSQKSEVKLFGRAVFSPKGSGENMAHLLQLLVSVDIP